MVAVADRIDALDGAAFAGITTFPALLFDQATRKVAPDAQPCDARTGAAEALAKAGRKKIEINATGHDFVVVLAALAEAGATQVEPGHGLTGTTPLHAVEDLPELPAVVYVSEVSHFHGGDAFCFGGGLYIDPIFPDYPVKAIVAREPTTAASALRTVEIPPPAAIDYYGMIDSTSGRRRSHGSATRSSSASGRRSSSPAPIPAAFPASPGQVPLVGAIHDALGRPADWPI